CQIIPHCGILCYFDFKELSEEESIALTPKKKRKSKNVPDRPDSPLSSNPITKTKSADSGLTGLDLKLKEPPKKRLSFQALRAVLNFTSDAGNSQESPPITPRRRRQLQNL